MSYIGNQLQNQNYVPAIDYFNGDGSTVAFTLSRPVASVAAVQAVISNVPQNPGSAFTVSGSTITFTSAPPSGTSNIYVYYTSPNTQVVQPGQGTVGTTQLATDLTLTNPTYTGTLTGGTGVVNIGSGQLYKDSSGNVGIGTSSPSAKLNVIQEVRVSYQSGSPYYLTLSDADGDCRINANGANAALLFGTTSSGGVLLERMRIDSSGNLLVNKTSNLAYSPKVQVSGASGVTALGVNCAPTSSNLVNWYYNTSIVASVSTNGSTVTYGTSSDYRLKNNIEPMQGGLAKVMQLKPSTWNWKRDGSDGQGFIAHELQAVVPDCVTGEKDAVDADGNPVYQGIDTSFLVATLTKAIQELKAELDVTKAEVAALKGAA